VQSALLGVMCATRSASLIASVAFLFVNLKDWN